MVQKVNFQSQNTESSIPLHVKYPFFMNIMKFLNLTIAPTCNSQNHIAMAIPGVPSPLHLDFVFLLILSLPPHSHLLRWSNALPASFSSTFLINPAHIPVYGAALTASMFYFWPCGKEAGDGCGTVFTKSTVGYSNILGLHIHSPLTCWFTQSNSCPASSTHGLSALIGAPF